MASSIESGVSGFNPPKGPDDAFAPGDGDGPELPPSCFSFEPAVWVDTDQDEFPDVESTVTASCAVTVTSGEFTILATNAYLDLAPGVPDFNFTSSYDGLHSFAGTINADEPGEEFEGQADFHDIGSDTATEAGNVFSIQQARDTGVDVFNAAGNPVYRTQETTGWSLSYTPGSVWGRGVGIVPGEVTVAGAWEVDVLAGEFHQRSNSSVVTISPLQVVDDVTCPTHIVGGQVRATFSENGETAMLDVTWLGCGQSQVSFTPPSDG